VPARCRLRREKHETHSRLSGRWGGGELTTGAPPSNTNRSRNTESAAASAAAVGYRWVGVSTVVYYPSDIAVGASRFFSVPLFLPHNIVTVPSFVRFLFGAISSLYRVGFRHVPPGTSPYPYCNNNTNKRSYRVHVVNARRI